MKYSVRNIDYIEMDGNIILPIFEGSMEKSDCSLSMMMEKDKIPKNIYNIFSGKCDENEVIHMDKYSMYLLGLGTKVEWSKLLLNIDCLVKKIYSLDINKIQIILTCSNLDLEFVINAFMLSFYRYTNYKSLDDNSYNKTVYFVVDIDEEAKCKLCIKMGNIINEIRSLTNSPRNHINVDNLASHISEQCMDHDIYVDILNYKKLKELGFGLICGVGQGSQNKPKMAVIHYKNLGDTQPIVLCGKGVLYDSGGYNLKGASMYYMNDDMYGAILVYGIIRVCKIFDIKINLIGICPLVENMIGSEAQRPSDICKAYDGTNVEIVDTDAEGRLILGDAIAYAKEFNPILIMAMATMTGCSDKIFSNKSSIMYSRDKYKKYVNPIIRIGKKYGEVVSYLPILDEMLKCIESDRADVKNTDLPSTGKAARFAYPAVFLDHFSPKEVPFIFWDISSMAINSDDGNPGASGYGLRLMVNYIRKLSGIASY
tara:strand:- start:4373 stop:5824 length:1452 start_codon:yes stop_codon:yes gene_type:complete